jgi:hypothetical protein
MNKAFKKITFFASALILLFFVLFVITQTSQVVELADKVGPEFGRIVFWGLLVIYAVLILIPGALFFRSSRSLTPPKSEDGPELTTYLEVLKKRLASNPCLKGLDLSNRQQIEKALTILAQNADEIIQRTAANVFISSAISQTGRLEPFLVLSEQSRMVWQIARLYYQRPMLRDLIRLYTNVAGTALLVDKIQDVDISEHVAPVLSSTLGSLAVTIPEFQLVTSILVNSVRTGTANAFLTLRVGIIARSYCGSLMIAERHILRRAASAEAAKLLDSIVRQGTAKLSKAVWRASKNRAGAVLEDTRLC